MRSIGSAVPSRRYSFALIVLLALSAVSCRTARKAQGEAMSQARTELSLDSSASRRQASETLTAESLATMETWEQAWMLLPLDSSGGGGIIVRGKGERRLLVGARSTWSTIGTDSSNVVRTASERHSNESKTEVRKPPDGLTELAGKVAFVIMAFGVSYLVITYKKQ